MGRNWLGFYLSTCVGVAKPSGCKSTRKWAQTTLVSAEDGRSSRGGDLKASQGQHRSLVVHSGVVEMFRHLDLPSMLSQHGLWRVAQFSVQLEGGSVLLVHHEQHLVHS